MAQRAYQPSLNRESRFLDSLRSLGMTATPRSRSRRLYDTTPGLPQARGRAITLEWREGSPRLEERASPSPAKPDRPSIAERFAIARAMHAASAALSAVRA